MTLVYITSDSTEIIILLPKEECCLQLRALLALISPSTDKVRRNWHTSWNGEKPEVTEIEEKLVGTRTVGVGKQNQSLTGKGS